jgi:hypothetical protein
MTFEQQPIEIDNSREVIGAQYDHMEARGSEVRALYAQLEEARYGEAWSRDKLLRGGHGNAGGIVLNIGYDQAELAEELADTQWCSFVCKNLYFPYFHAGEHPLRQTFIDTIQSLPDQQPNNTPLELAGLQAAHFDDFDRFAAGMDGVRPIMGAEQRALEALCEHQRFLLFTAQALEIPMFPNFAREMDKLEIRVRLQLIGAHAEKGEISTAEAQLQQQAVLAQGRELRIDQDALQAIYEKAAIS